MNKSFFTVAIGASAGGLPALKTFFDHIPAHTDIAFVLVNHLIRDHRSMLKEILSSHTQLPVVRVERKTALQAGKIYVIVENTSLRVKNGYLIATPRDAGVINCSVDIFLESLAVDFKAKAIGIILSGGGNDGLKGAKKIAEMGGFVMVQDPQSAQVNGMPSSIINGDHPRAILDPSELAQRLTHFCNGQTVNG